MQTTRPPREAPASTAHRARDTIVAISTAPGRAAIAVLRLSGPDAGSALEAIAGALPPPRHASLRTLRNPADGGAIDRGVVLWFPGPASQTGEDMAELHVHGGRAVVDATLRAALGLPGVRLAEAGEFVRRAFVAGRMDLAEAEGLADLIDAETEAQRKQALLQSEGGLSGMIDGWRSRLLSAMSLVEAGIDFSDEDGVPEAVRAEARREVARLAAELGAALADTRAERLRDGFQIAILGRPNAGKSSLLNALARRDVAIVTEAPGTTRDVIEVRLDLGGAPVVIADTAGLRDTADAAETEGVRRATMRAEAADLVLWLEDAAAAPEPPPADIAAARLWRIASKIDLAPSGGDAAAHRISIRTGQGIEDLVADLARAAADCVGSGAEIGLTRERHRDAVAGALVALQEALAEWEGLQDEILAELLRGAAAELGRVTGRIGVEEVLGAIFSSFCIGK